MPWLAASGLGLGAVCVWSLMLWTLHRRAFRTTHKYRLLGELSAEVNRAVLLNQDEETIFLTILDYALRILDHAKLGTVLRFNDEGKLVIAASRGFDPDYVRGFQIRLEDTWQYRQTGGQITDAVIITPHTILHSGYRHDARSQEFRAVISTPLFVGGQLYGLLNLDSHHEHTFAEEDVEVMRWFRSQIEVCLLARDLYRTALADSRVDGLTKFLTRATFDERFQQTLERAERYGESFTVGMFDIDGLKAVNDEFGHGAGDALLRAVADSLRQAARKSDTLGRYGGDEFVALFPGTNASAMNERAATILAELHANPPRFENRVLRASFSYGFADYPAEGKTFRDLVAAADQKLYRARTDRPRRTRR